MVFGFKSRPKPPAELTAVLRPDEEVLALAQDAGGNCLAATRYGVWKVHVGKDPYLFNWSAISKAKWQPPILQIVIADVVGQIGGADLIVDRVPMNIEISDSTKLTDIIHNRTRAGIVSSEHHELPGGGGAWLVVRRVPGQDGVAVQVRLDPGTDPDVAAEQLPDLIAAAKASFSSD